MWSVDDRPLVVFISRWGELLLDQAALVVKTCEQVSVCDEHVIALVHGCDAPAFSGFNAVEFAAVPTKAVESVDGVDEVVAAVAAVHPALFHGNSPVGEFTHA